MPTYHYRCSNCGHSFDFFQKFADDPLTTCPECEGTIRRVPQPVGVVFKGSGWYITDSRKSSSSSNGSGSTSEKSAEGGKETKSDSSAGKQPASVSGS